MLTPVELNVPDPEATRRLREKALETMPRIFRFYPQAGSEAEADLRAAFKLEHEKFLALLKRAYRLRRLNEPSVNHPSFGQFLAWARNQDESFLCATNLTRAWALGEDFDETLRGLTTKLRQAQQRYIGPDVHADKAEKPASIFVFTCKSREAIPEIEAVEKRSREVSGHELYTLAEARRELEKSFSGSDQALAGFLAGFLRENCTYDPELSRRVQMKKAAELTALAHYSPGEAIVRAEQTVDAKAKAALDALEQMRAAELKKSIAAAARAEKINAMKSWCQERVIWVLAMVENADGVDYAMWSSLAGMLFVLYLLRRHRKQTLTLPVPATNQPMSYTVILNPAKNETIFLPAKPQANPEPAALPPASPPPPAIAAVPPPEGQDAEWAERALDAERRAEELLAMVRSGLAPHLAKELMNRLVQELISQRNLLLQTQRMAGKEINAIEARFNSIYQNLQAQLQAYEKRTHELEGKLADKDQTNAELLKAMIVTQKKLNSSSTQSGNTSG